MFVRVCFAYCMFCLAVMLHVSAYCNRLGCWALQVQLLPTQLQHHVTNTNLLHAAKARGLVECRLAPACQADKGFSCKRFEFPCAEFRGHFRMEMHPVQVIGTQSRKPLTRTNLRPATFRAYRATISPSDGQRTVLIPR